MQLKTCLVYKFVFLLFNIRYSSLEETNKLDCGDENCTVPIGSGKAQSLILPHSEGYLKLKAGEEAQIFGVFGKEVFLVETNDKRRGFVSQVLFREMSLNRKELVKSNVTTVQKKRLKDMKPNVEKEKRIQEKKAEVTTPANESEVPEVKPVVEGRTPAGQVVFQKEETPILQEKNVTEEEEEEEEDLTAEMDEDETEEEETESTETATEASMLAKVVNFITGGDNTEDDNEKTNDTETQSSSEDTLQEEVLVQNDTAGSTPPVEGQNLPTEPEKQTPKVQISQESTKEQQTDAKKPENVVEEVRATTSLPEPNEIATPPLAVILGTTPTPPRVENEPANVVEIIGTTPTPPQKENEPPKVEQVTPKADNETTNAAETIPTSPEVKKEIPTVVGETANVPLASLENVTNPMSNDTDKDLGTPEFKPIPDTVLLKLNTTEEEVKADTNPTTFDKVSQTTVPGTGNVITTPPPLLGLGKGQTLKDNKKKKGKQEEKKLEKVVAKVEPETPVVEVKPHDVNNMLAHKPVKVENTNSSDVVPVPAEKGNNLESSKENTEETVAENKETSQEELEKVKQKLGVADDEVPKGKESEMKSEEQQKEEKPVEHVHAGHVHTDHVHSEHTHAKHDHSGHGHGKHDHAEHDHTHAKHVHSGHDHSEHVHADHVHKDHVHAKLPPPPSNPLGIDTYGNPPPPMKPLEETAPVAETAGIDDKLDLYDGPKEKEVPVPAPDTNSQTTPPALDQSEQEPESKLPKTKHNDHDFDHKRETVRNLLQSEAPTDGSEVDSNEVKEPEMETTKVKQGVPSIVEIRRNGKLVTPKDAPEEPKKQETNPHSGEYCEAGGGSCPAESSSTIAEFANMFGLDILLQDGFLQSFADKTMEMLDLIIYLSITATAVIFFLLMHSCVKRCMRESPLLEKINHLERSLMTSIKENATLKNDLGDAKGKLHKIEDTSFGSNEMVIALKKDLDDSEHIRHQLQQQCNMLEEELQRSAAAGTELNKMLSDLLNSQTGSESILQSVEQLQKQLDEQQLTIESMTDALSTKSRENSELQVQLSEISSKLGMDIKTLKARNDDVELEKVCIENELKNLKKTVDERIDMIEKSKQEEIERIKQKLARKEKEALELHQKYRTSEAKIQALNECINESKKNGGDASDYLDSIDSKADLILVTKERDTLKEQLNSEINAKKSMESYFKSVGDDIENLKKQFSVAEKEKLEAQTRLDVLSSYFRQKESELQRELSIKEALWMQQQGETTTTVERVKSMQEEIQQLKSQNDSLKAEILAQDTAYKAQTVALENKAHEAWLTARQSERKVEEFRQEATILRRRLTSIAELQPMSGNNSMSNVSSNHIDGISGMPSMPSLNSVPSPLRVESPNSPIMLPGMPPPPQYLPPGQFMPPGPLPSGLPPGVPPLPFMPPPPFDLPSRPPHGRLISPPPRGYSPSLIDDRYSPDSRYHDDYSVMSTRYDTETDFSPPPSPPKHSRNTSSGYSRQNGAKNAYSPTTSPKMNGRHNNNNNNRNKSNKGGFNSSGSQDSIIGSGSRKGHHGKI